MINLGKKADVIGADELRELTVTTPITQLPSLPANHRVICGFEQGLGEKLIVCESLSDMQELYDSYRQGGALRIKWYSGENPGFIMVIAK